MFFVKYYIALFGFIIGFGFNNTNIVILYRIHNKMKIKKGELNKLSSLDSTVNLCFIKYIFKNLQFVFIYVMKGDWVSRAAIKALYIIQYILRKMQLIRYGGNFYAQFWESAHLSKGVKDVAFEKFCFRFNGIRRIISPQIIKHMMSNFVRDEPFPSHFVTRVSESYVQSRQTGR